MSTEARVYTRRHQGAKVDPFDFSNVIYRKFSHGGISYTLNGKNIKVVLERIIILIMLVCCIALTFVGTLG